MRWKYLRVLRSSLLPVSLEARRIINYVAKDVKLASVTSLYAYFYQPNPPFDATDGWSIYNPRQEFVRMGVGTRTKAWRLTDINKDYRVRL